MAKQRFGINDAYRGTVGTVIGYEWRGRWCLRARPLRVRNPRTAKQQANRLLFKQMVALAGTFKKALRKGLHALSMAEHITECNYFVKYNKQCFSLGDGGCLAVDYENLVVSAGELAAPLFGEGQTSLTSLTSLTSTTSLTVPFAPCGEGERASGDDEVYLWAFCPEAGEGVLSCAAYRKAGSVQLTLPERWQGKAVHLYGFAVDYRGEASATVYLGALEPAAVNSQAIKSQNGRYPDNEKNDTTLDDCAGVRHLELWTTGDGLGVEGRREDGDLDTQRCGAGGSGADDGER